MPSSERAAKASKRSAAWRTSRSRAPASTSSCITTRRSEERRVGKECRYRCDWISDVCSSDLDAEQRARGEGVEAERRLAYVAFTRAREHLELHHDAEIGRASCRERV